MQQNHYCVLCALLFTEVAVRFQQSSYTVLEGQMARVCIDVVGATDIEINIEVTVSPIDAERKGQKDCIVL